MNIVKTPLYARRHGMQMGEFAFTLDLIIISFTWLFLLNYVFPTPINITFFSSFFRNYLIFMFPSYVQQKQANPITTLSLSLSVSPKQFHFETADLLSRPMYTNGTILSVC